MKSELWQRLTPWEWLLKKMTIQQVGPLHDKKILDFGSGQGFLANYYADTNQVIAIEPAELPIDTCFIESDYRRIQGGIEQLAFLEDASFDWIFCHNVLEYVEEKDAIMKEFARILRPTGQLSLIHHNRNGRIMQMAVLLDDCATAQALLAGENSVSSRYGAICYYQVADYVEKAGQWQSKAWFGMRTFFDLQQQQERQSHPEWQKQMLQLELSVAQVPEFRNIAFFHHHLLVKKTDDDS